MTFSLWGLGDGMRGFFSSFSCPGEGERKANTPAVVVVFFFFKIY